MAKSIHTHSSVFTISYCTHYSVILIFKEGWLGFYYSMKTKQIPKTEIITTTNTYSKMQSYSKQESLAVTSMARDDPPASSTAATMRSKVGSEFET